MGINIIEIKAKLRNEELIRAQLEKHNAWQKGIDTQTDTYFNAPAQGDRLKLREGSVENNLIYYKRSNTANPKLSEVILYSTKPGDQNLKNILTQLLGVKVVVRKKREIYFVENVKIHIDQVEGLGSFVEIEAIDEQDERTKSELQTQCEYFMNAFEIDQEDLLTFSYSDMLEEKLKTA